jgi:hypothetical protein
MNTAKTTRSAAEMTVGSATSRDGTSVGYLRLGQGPADHGGSSDASGTNPGGGKPEIVAEEVRRFFSRR